jgi:DUF4097 and DUF4098 domain-containing protein YvlB
MPTFPTPDPVVATIDVIGDVRVTASDRLDTIVVVRPADRSKKADIRAAEATTVECRDGRLLVKMPRHWRQHLSFGGGEAVDVTIELPTDSQVTVDSALGRFSADGELGECRLKMAMGDIRLDQTGALRAVTAYGNVTVDLVVGDAEVTTASGDIQVNEIEGEAVIKNSNGDTAIGEVTGDVRVKAANGDVKIGRAHGSATAKTANGDVRIAEVSRGTVVLETAAGELEVGIREGTAAWLDVVTSFGSVRNTIGTVDEPTPSDPRVEIRGRTSVGDILINRAPSADNVSGNE